MRFWESLRRSFRYNGVQLTTVVTGVMALVLGLVYFGPEDLYRFTRPEASVSEQTSLVLAVQHIGPIWSFLFVGMGMALIGTATARRWVIQAHVLAVFGWVFYGMAVLLGSALSEPPAPIVAGAMALGVASIHYGLIQAHQELGDS